MSLEKAAPPIVMSPKSVVILYLARLSLCFGQQSWNHLLERVCMKILVVDDNREVTMVLKRLLQREDHEVLTADNGLEGYFMYLHFQPEIILTGIHMPGKGGFELIDAIRLRNPGIKAIYMSGNPGACGARLAAETHRYGSDMLCKPFNRNQLQRALQNVQN
ncbi:MAG TPA: response regulator [Desulfobacterales bacterium]